MVMESFSRKLKATDVGSKLSWPTGKLHLLPPGRDQHRRLLSAVDATGKEWGFTCATRGRGPYLKPVLTASTWLPFVRAKRLAVHDLVVFHCGPTPGRFRIRVQRLKTFKLMGTPIATYAPEE